VEWWGNSWEGGCGGKFPSCREGQVDLMKPERLEVDDPRRCWVHGRCAETRNLEAKGSRKRVRRGRLRRLGNNEGGGGRGMK